MSESWSLPGYDVQALLGAGSGGELWRALDVATGQTVVLQRLTVDADPAAVGEAAAVLEGLQTPYVLRLRSVLASGSGTVLVLDDAAGGSLAALLERRGRLEPAEVVTVAVPLARALAAAHARGLVHGGLTSADVLFTAEGMPLLSGWWPLRAAGGDGAAGDVRALAELCRQMLTGAPPVPDPDAPPALVKAVEAALAVDPGARPNAAALAVLLSRAHPATPVRLTGRPAERRPAPESPGVVRPSAAPRAGLALRVPQGLLVPAGVLAVVLAGALAGWLSGRGMEQAPPPLPARNAAPAAGSTATPAAAPTTPAAGADAASAAAPAWVDLLDVLDSRRTQAFSTGRASALSQVYAAGSAALAADTARLQELVDRGQTAHGLRHTVRSVQVLQQTASTVLLRVDDVLAAYEVRDRQGAVVRRSPGRGEQGFLVRLVRTAGRWRIVEVRTAG